MAKTGKAEPEVVREIERYVVWPGQATAYKVGQLALLQMRAQAEQALGDRFSLPAFHEVVLRAGSVPLAVLQEVVNDWIASQQATPG
jgi:uncharacterized protein (DUF885 family)